jgi:hypothetical protein
VGWKDLLPREHALWGWVGVPLFGSLCVEPGAAVALAALATLAGFGTWNAAGRWARGSDRARDALLPAAAVAVAAAVAAVWAAERPILSALALGGAGLAAGVAMWTTHGRLRQDPGAEAAAIVALAIYGAGVGVGAGADVRSAAMVQAATATWLLLGLWWINRTLAPLLPHRRRWRYGLVVAGASAVASFGVALATGVVAVGFVPLLYAVRILSQRPAVGARDARRLGLVELGWSLAISLAVALAAGCGPEGTPGSRSGRTEAPLDSAGADDTGPLGGNFDPDPACDYAEWTEVVQLCGASRTSLWTYRSLSGDPACPKFVEVDGATWTELEDARIALGCDNRCVYVSAVAVMVLYCDTRGEFTQYTDGGPGQTEPAGSCPSLQHWETVAGAGWYESAAAYAAEHPCP